MDEIQTVSSTLERDVKCARRMPTNSVDKLEEKFFKKTFTIYIYQFGIQEFNCATSPDHKVVVNEGNDNSKLISIIY